ncbi:hypothetical protein BDQ17DRAFT_1302895 [Cyathus striatus]|nr:hypothetical protein BDQ17DRAFT_1302895 [Cyathus striatus]
MILITFDPTSLPMGPRSMLAHFPRGRPRLTTQALVGMTDTVTMFKIRTPKIYAYIDSMPNDIGAEVVLLEKVPGENMADIWTTLSPNLQFMVLVRIAETLCSMFNFRGSLICTDLLGTGTDTRPGAQGEKRPVTHKPVLLAPPFDQGPLNGMPPVPAMKSAEEYLNALANRIDRVFTETSTGEPTPENLSGRKSRIPGGPDLTYLEVQRAKDTWSRLASLIPYHIGGFYLPSTLPRRAREAAIDILQSNYFGVKHTDMKMTRFIVDIQPNEPPREGHKINVTLTGWEHAHRAPLWSCAMLPPFLSIQVGAREAIPDEQKPYFRDLFVGRIICDERLLGMSWQWFIAHVYGEAERWFEGCLNTHWQLRDDVEFLLPFLKSYWEVHRPDVPFPIPVGREYAAPGDTSLGAEDRPEIIPNPRVMAIDQGSGALGRTLGEEWKTVMNKWIAYVK